MWERSFGLGSLKQLKKVQKKKNCQIKGVSNLAEGVVGSVYSSTENDIQGVSYGPEVCPYMKLFHLYHTPVKVICWMIEPDPCE